MSMFPNRYLFGIGASTEMAVRSGSFKNRIPQTKTLYDLGGTQIEQFADPLCNLPFGDRQMIGTVRIDIDAQRTGNADRIGELNEHLVSDAGCHHILAM